MKPSLQRAAAVVAFFAVFLIPIATSSLGGLTQLVTCKATEAVGFTLVVPSHGEPTIITSESLQRGQPATVSCPGLNLNLQAGFARTGGVFIELNIHNNSRFAWEGTVVVHLGSLNLPVPVGRILAGQVRRSRVDVIPGVGAHQVDGQLLVGP
ncbi:MAG: hypothetical protein ACYCTI_00920 [Acidimicrobiales bacterium]